jgi:hypothetical protein
MMRVVVLAAALVVVQANGAESDGTSFHNDPAPNVRVNRENVQGGAQLVTLFVPAPYDLAPAYPAGIPVISYLKDTLGDPDPENDRVRLVWVLTAGKPSHLRQVLSAVPVVSFGRDEGTTWGIPDSAVDLGNPTRGTWSNILRVVVQGQVLDPTGMAVRTSSRAYAWNSQSRDDLNVYEAMALLTRLGAGAVPDDVASDLRAVHARLLLSRRTLGGLVRDRRLEGVYEGDNANRQLARAHNWELVRQEAEANRLYFEPISFGDPEPTHAIVWVRRGEVANTANSFTPGLLQITRPWGDQKLMNWKGYTETWQFDENGSRTTTDAGESDQMIPLALYSLDYPRVPLIVVDFRSSAAPQRRETAARIVQNVTRGALGFSPIANWNYFAAQWVWDWIAARHGAANDRPARLRAYAETSYLLSMDESLRGPLRAELKRRLQGSSPLLSRRARVATTQYENLAQIDRSRGVLAILERDRGSELTSYSHGPWARFGLMLARAGTLGTFRHTERPASPLAILDTQRRIAYHTRILQTAVDRNVPLDAFTGAPAVRRSVVELVDRSRELRNNGSVSRLITRVMALSQDEPLRAACVHAVESLRPDVEPVKVARSNKGECANCRGSIAAAAPVATLPLGHAH